jgi:hypothetical protein
MPRRMTSSWTAQRTRNAAQPIGVKPRMRGTSGPSSGVNWGHTENSSTNTASEASQVWMPYQAMAMSARISAARLAPKRPKDIRARTGYGTPVFCPAVPAKFIRK